MFHLNPGGLLSSLQHLKSKTRKLRPPFDKRDRARTKSRLNLGLSTQVALIMMPMCLSQVSAQSLFLPSSFGNDYCYNVSVALPTSLAYPKGIGLQYNDITIDKGFRFVSGSVVNEGSTIDCSSNGGQVVYGNVNNTGSGGNQVWSYKISTSVAITCDKTAFSFNADSIQRQCGCIQVCSDQSYSAIMTAATSDTSKVQIDLTTNPPRLKIDTSVGFAQTSINVNLQTIKTNFKAASALNVEVVFPDKLLPTNSQGCMNVELNTISDLSFPQMMTTETITLNVNRGFKIIDSSIQDEWLINGNKAPAPTGCTGQTIYGHFDSNNDTKIWGILMTNPSFCHKTVFGQSDSTMRQCACVQVCSAADSPTFTSNVGPITFNNALNQMMISTSNVFAIQQVTITAQNPTSLSQQAQNFFLEINSPDLFLQPLVSKGCVGLAINTVSDQHLKVQGTPQQISFSISRGYRIVGMVQNEWLYNGNMAPAPSGCTGQTVYGNFDTNSNKKIYGVLLSSPSFCHKSIFGITDSVNRQCACIQLCTATDLTVTMTSSSGLITLSTTSDPATMTVDVSNTLSLSSVTLTLNSAEFPFAKDVATFNMEIRNLLLLQDDQGAYKCYGVKLNPVANQVLTKSYYVGQKQVVSLTIDPGFRFDSSVPIVDEPGTISCPSNLVFYGNTNSSDPQGVFGRKGTGTNCAKASFSITDFDWRQCACIIPCSDKPLNQVLSLTGNETKVTYDLQVTPPVAKFEWFDLYNIVYIQTTVQSLSTTSISTALHNAQVTFPAIEPMINPVGVNSNNTENCYHITMGVIPNNTGPYYISPNQGDVAFSLTFDYGYRVLSPLVGEIYEWQTIDNSTSQKTYNSISCSSSLIAYSGTTSWTVPTFANLTSGCWRSLVSSSITGNIRSCSCAEACSIGSLPSEIVKSIQIHPALANNEFRFDMNQNPAKLIIDSTKSFTGSYIFRIKSPVHLNGTWTVARSITVCGALSTNPTDNHKFLKSTKVTGTTVQDSLLTSQINTWQTQLFMTGTAAAAITACELNIIKKYSDATCTTEVANVYPDTLIANGINITYDQLQSKDDRVIFLSVPTKIDVRPCVRINVTTCGFGKMNARSNTTNPYFFKNTPSVIAYDYSTDTTEFFNEPLTMFFEMPVSDTQYNANCTTLTNVVLTPIEKSDSQAVQIVTSLTPETTPHYLKLYKTVNGRHIFNVTAWSYHPDTSYSLKLQFDVCGNEVLTTSTTSLAPLQVQFNQDDLVNGDLTLMMINSITNSSTDYLNWYADKIACPIVRINNLNGSYFSSEPTRKTEINPQLNAISVYTQTMYSEVINFFVYTTQNETLTGKVRIYVRIKVVGTDCSKAIAQKRGFIKPRPFSLSELTGPPQKLIQYVKDVTNNDTTFTAISWRSLYKPADFGACLSIVTNSSGMTWNNSHLVIDRSADRDDFVLLQVVQNLSPPVITNDEIMLYHQVCGNEDWTFNSTKTDWTQRFRTPLSSPLTLYPHTDWFNKGSDSGHCIILQNLTTLFATDTNSHYFNEASKIMTNQNFIVTLTSTTDANTALYFNTSSSSSNYLAGAYSFTVKLDTMKTTMYKNLTFIVCGMEVISLAQTTSLIHVMFNSATPVQDITALVQSWFTQTFAESCAIQEFVVQSSGNIVTTSTDRMYTVSQNAAITLNPHNVPNYVLNTSVVINKASSASLIFYVNANSLSVTSLPITVNLTVCGDHTIIREQAAHNSSFIATYNPSDNQGFAINLMSYSESSTYRWFRSSILHCWIQYFKVFYDNNGTTPASNGTQIPASRASNYQDLWFDNSTQMLYFPKNNSNNVYLLLHVQAVSYYGITSAALIQLNFTVCGTQVFNYINTNPVLDTLFNGNGKPQPEYLHKWDDLNITIISFNFTKHLNLSQRDNLYCPLTKFNYTFDTKVDLRNATNPSIPDAWGNHSGEISLQALYDVKQNLQIIDSAQNSIYGNKGFYYGILSVWAISIDKVSSPLVFKFNVCPPIQYTGYKLTVMDYPTLAYNLTQTNQQMISLSSMQSLFNATILCPITQVQVAFIASKKNFTQIDGIFVDSNNQSLMMTQFSRADFQTLNITAINNVGYQSSFILNVSACGDEVLTPVNPGGLALNYTVNKVNQTVQEFFGNFTLIQSTFETCGIINHNIYSGPLVAQIQDLYTYNGTNQLSFNTATKNLTVNISRSFQQSFWFSAVSFSDQKNLTNITVTVCGDQIFQNIAPKGDVYLLAAKVQDGANNVITREHDLVFNSTNKFCSYLGAVMFADKDRVFAYSGSNLTISPEGNLMINTQDFYQESVWVTASFIGNLSYNFRVDLKIICGYVNSTQLKTPKFPTLITTKQSFPHETLVFQGETDDKNCPIFTQTLQLRVNNSIVANLTQYADYTENLKGNSSIKLKDLLTIQKYNFWVRFTSEQFDSINYYEIGTIDVQKLDQQPPRFTIASNTITLSSVMTQYKDFIFECMNPNKPSELPKVIITNTTQPDYLDTVKIVDWQDGKLIVIFYENDKLKKTVNFTVQGKLQIKDALNSTQVIESNFNLILSQVYAVKAAENQTSQITPVQNSTINTTTSSNTTKETLTVEQQKERDRLAALKKKQDELAKQGLVQTEFGMLFPGMNTDLIKNAKTNNQNKLPDPQVELSKINSQGIATIEFNREMLYPFPKFSYSKCFRLGIWFAVRDKIYYGLPGEKPNQTVSNSTIAGNGEGRRLEQNEQDPVKKLVQYQDSGMPLFYYQVVEHQATFINIHLDLVDPRFISQGSEKDKLVLEILIPDMFITQSMPPIKLKVNSVESEAKASRSVLQLPKFADVDTVESIASASQSIGNLFNAVTSGNFFISILIQGSMQQLFGMIRALQMIVLSGLIENNFPAHTGEFYKGCMLFAQMDLFDGQGYYEVWFPDLLKTSPVNPNFEFLGMSNSNYLLNSGSFYIIGAFMIAWWVIKKTLHILFVYCAQFEKARKLSIYLGTYDSHIISPLIKLNMEFYFDCVLGCMMMFHAFNHSESKKFGFLDFLSTKNNIMCTVLTLVQAAILLSLPFVASHLLETKTKSGQIKTKEYRRKYEVMIGETNKADIYSLKYNVYFMYRRMISAVVLVYMEKYPFFQCTILTVLSTINFIYMWSQKPLPTKHENNVEIFNEFTILVCCHLVTIFLNSLPFKFSATLGWYLIGIISFNIIINLGIVLRGTCLGIYRTRKQHNIMKKRDEAVKAFWNEKAKLVQEDKEGLFDDIKHSDNLQKALNFCISWKPQRDWLKKNKLDIKQFPEEVLYRRYLRKFNFDEEIKQQRFRIVLAKALHLKTVQTIGSTIVENKRKALKKQTDLKFTEFKKADIIQAKIKKFNLGNLTKVEEISEESNDSVKGPLDYTTVFKKQQSQVQSLKILQKHQEYPQYFLKAYQDTIRIKQNQQKLADTSFGKKVGNLDNLIKQTELQYQSFKFNDLNDIKTQQEIFPLHKLQDESQDAIEQDEYVHEVLQIIDRSPSLLWEDYKTESITHFMNEGDKPGLLAAIMQCLVPIESVNQFFIFSFKKVEQKIKTSPVSSAVYEALIENCRKQLDVYMEQYKQISLTRLKNAIEDQLIEFPNPSDFYEAFMKKLFDELVQTKKGKDFVNYKLKFVTNFQVICRKHNEIFTEVFSNNYLMKIARGGSVKQAIRDYFNARYQANCPTCLKEAYQQRRVIKLPSVMVIGFDSNDATETKIDLRLSFSKYLMKDEIIRSENLHAVYDLVGVIYFEPDKPNQYESYSKRRNPSNGNQVQWARVTESKVFEIKLDKKLKHSVPQILFYQLCTTSHDYATSEEEDKIQSDPEEQSSEESSSDSQSSQEEEAKKKVKAEPNNELKNTPSLPN